jgi:hypothetical protein
MTLYLPGAGFGFWYNWGVIEGLQTPAHLEVVSGSALAAVCYLCRLDVERQIQMCSPLRRSILVRLNGTLRDWLQRALPSRCAQICNGRVTILVRRFPSRKVHRFTHWRDKDHLIDALVASCSPIVPVSVDGVYYVDCLTYVSEHPTIPSRISYRVPTEDQARANFHKGRKEGRKEGRNK